MENAFLAENLDFCEYIPHRPPHAMTAEAGTTAVMYAFQERKYLNIVEGYPIIE
jgi:hypothetical protein